MLEDCNYTKAKLVTELSQLVWYLKKHAKADAKKAGHTLCHAMCEEMEKDLEKHLDKVRMAIEGLSKEGKFR